MRQSLYDTQRIRGFEQESEKYSGATVRYSLKRTKFQCHRGGAKKVTLEVKDYVKYSKTRTPAWYNSDNVTEEEIFVATGDNVKEVANYFKQKLARQEAEAAAKTAAK